MGKTTTYTYNALGKVESVKDFLNHRTEFIYNSRGQNTEVRDAANNVSSATYDLLGNVTRLAGPLGGATNYTYDDMGRLVSESTVSGGTKSYEYNELNIRKKVTNARGQIRQVFYDAMGRITGFTSPEGAVSYTYDANGNVLTVNDSHGTITRTYDALNRVSSYTDTYGKIIRYEYDAVGNLSKIIYPDNTAVTYAYDANHNLIRVTDWANRLTSYTYDENNRVVGVTKPDGSMATTVYDSKQRVTSTVERTAGGVVITGFEYTYDDLSRIVEEKVLANSTKMCYSYDNLSRVTARTIKKLSDNSVVSTETFSYDAAGNVTSAPDSSFRYDTNNRLISFNGNSVSYDLDGNMLSNGSLTCTYDSANRLVSAGGHTYTYNAEDVRIGNLCADEDTTYTYNTNAKLSMLLMKTTGDVVTKYVYGRGLIGEETNNIFKTYHFDCRGSTIVITDASGIITDTFAYDTYGKLITRTGTSKVIFGYNGRDGVMTDSNGLIYMRVRYYSPEMKRFVNADIVAGKLSNAITLNRFAYANGNPVSFVDPFGLSVDTKGSIDSAALFDILRKINSERDTKFASEMLAAVLDQLLCFKNILVVGHTISVEIPVGLNTTITYSSSVKSGSGNFEVGSVISDQLELAGNCTFPMGDNGSISVDNDGIISVGIEYSADVDEYTTISASISAKSNSSITAGYTITTNDGYDNVVSTSIELTHKVEKQPPTAQTEDVHGPSLESAHNSAHISEPEEGIVLAKLGEVGMALAVTTVAIGATAETFITIGAGAWNDVPAWGAAVASWTKVFAQ